MIEGPWKKWLVWIEPSGWSQTESSVTNVKTLYKPIPAPPHIRGRPKQKPRNRCQMTPPSTPITLSLIDSHAKGPKLARQWGSKASIRVRIVHTHRLILRAAIKQRNSARTASQRGWSISANSPQPRHAQYMKSPPLHCQGLVLL